MSEPRTLVLIPIKSFDASKSRLRGALSDDDTVVLTRRLARGVINAAHPRECRVVCDDDEVAEFARECGATALIVESRTLNDALREAIDQLDGVDVIVIAHGDLARPEGLGQFSPNDGVTIVTDRHRSGTNVLALPAGVAFDLAFGADSARRHEQEARRRGLAVTVITDSPWGYDVDVPDDLTEPLT